MIRGVPTKQFLLDLKHEVGEDNMFNCAAALAYYLTLALFPGMILLMTIIPYLPIDNVDQAIMDLLAQAMPEEAYGIVEDVVDEVTQNRRGGLLSFSVVATLWAASAGMYAVMRQLNITYNVDEARSFIKARGTAILLSILFGLLVIGAFVLIVVGGMVEDWLGSHFGFSEPLMLFFAAFRWLVILLALFLALAMIYRYAPNLKQRFSLMTPGSVVGVVLLILASLGFSIYTSNFANYDATYGSLGAVIVLMLWLYIAGVAILLGSEINALLQSYTSHGKRKGELREDEHPNDPPEGQS